MNEYAHDLFLVDGYLLEKFRLANKKILKISMELLSSMKKIDRGKLDFVMKEREEILSFLKFATDKRILGRSAHLQAFLNSRLSLSFEARTST